MKTTSLPATVCRWAARIVSAFAVAVIVIIAVGEGMPILRLVTNLFTHPLTTESLGFVGFALMVTGLLAGWRWELTGGILSFAGVCLIFEPTRVNGKITWFFAVLLVPGVLYVTSHLLRGHASRHTPQQLPQ
jgi:hypothetical protein